MSSVPGQLTITLHPTFRDTPESSELGLLWGLTTPDLVRRSLEAARGGASGVYRASRWPQRRHSNDPKVLKARSPCLMGKMETGGQCLITGASELPLRVSK